MKINKCKYLLITIFLFIYIRVSPFERIFDIIDINQSDYFKYKGKYILKSLFKKDYISKIQKYNINDVQKEIRRINNYFFNLPLYSNDSQSKALYKKDLLSYISKSKSRNISRIDTIYLSRNINFGNNIIAINNCIFYCEILDCHQIILNLKGNARPLLIKNPINISSLGINIKLDTNIDCFKDIIFCPYETNWEIYYPKFVIPEIRTDFIKNEILSNLPLVIIKYNDLYIHIRGGDVFNTKNTPSTYSQPPLCFYDKIIENNKFQDIYIISMDNSNVIVNALLNKYKNIIYNKNNILFDISLLIQAYNIVASVSSFVLSSIKLNKNLMDFWEYDIMRLSQKILFLHHHLFKFPIKYNIHTMKPSDTYSTKMFTWERSSEQIKLMLEDNCPYDFIHTKIN